MTILSPKVWFPKNIKQATSLLWWKNIYARFCSNLWKISYNKYMSMNDNDQRDVLQILKRHKLGSNYAQLLVYLK